MCINCQHNTAGINCERCKPGYYKRPNVPITSPFICAGELLGFFKTLHLYSTNNCFLIFSTHKRQLSVSLQQTCFGSVFCIRPCYSIISVSITIAINFATYTYHYLVYHNTDESRRRCRNMSVNKLKVVVFVLKI